MEENEVIKLLSHEFDYKKVNIAEIKVLEAIADLNFYERLEVLFLARKDIMEMIEESDIKKDEEADKEAIISQS